MTFYWWSHWFWITLLLSNNFLSLIVVVFTYPSQKVILLDYRQNLKFYDKNAINKLYQTTIATLAVPKSRNNYSNNFLNSTTKSMNLTQNTEFNEKGDLDKDVFKEESCEKDEHPKSQNDTGKESKVIHKNVNNSSHVVFTYFISESDKEVKRSAELDVSNDDNDNNKTNHSNVVEGDVKETGNKLILEKYNYPNINEDSMNFTNHSIPIIVDKDNDNNKDENNNITAKETYLGKEKLQSTLSVTQGTTNTSEHFTINVTKYEMPFTLENVKTESSLRKTELEQRSRKSKGLTAEYRHIQRFINYSADAKSLLTRSASTKPNNYDNDDSNVSSEALTVQHAYLLDVGSVSGICIGIFGICSVIGAFSIMLYRRRYLNKPQTLSEPDSSVYIDDNTMRDNSDEMYSLDNDSFLNSLEAMTIQNYWTDTVKHTKL